VSVGVSVSVGECECECACVRECECVCVCELGAAAHVAPEDITRWAKASFDSELSKDPAPLGFVYWFWFRVGRRV